jgi:plasmid stability protein
MGQRLHIRNVPDGVVERVKRTAIQHRRSINSEIVSTLELHYASDDSATQLAIVDRIRRRKAEYPASSPTETLEIIREDRER